MLEKLFDLRGNGTSVRTEIIAGFTTFATIIYILSVNPAILSDAGVPKEGAFAATAIAAAVASIVMGLVAKLPFALMPGMGLNAFFAYTVVLGMGYTWQMALAAVFVEGVIFLLLSIFNIRELVIKSIPMDLKHAIGAGIGLFIAYIGFANAGIIVQGVPVTTIGYLESPMAILALFGIAITAILYMYRVVGALFLGIIITTLLGIPFGLTDLSGIGTVVSLPDVSGTFLHFDFSKLFTLDFLVVLAIFLFVDIFDTAGTFIAVARTANLIEADGRIKNVKRGFLSDAIGTLVGAMFGTSTVTTVVESAAGVSAGGRTGLTAVTVGVLFLVAMMFYPLFSVVPLFATTPVLVVVGFLMFKQLLGVDFECIETSVPAFLTIAIIPLGYSIAEGISLGIILYSVLMVVKGRGREVYWLTYVIAALFIVKIGSHFVQ